MKNIDPFFEHLSLIDSAGKMIEHSKLRLYELKGRLEIEMGKEEKKRFDLTLKSQLRIDKQNLRKELIDIVNKLSDN